MIKPTTNSQLMINNHAPLAVGHLGGDRESSVQEKNPIFLQEDIELSQRVSTIRNFGLKISSLQFTITRNTQLTNILDKMDQSLESFSQASGNPSGDQEIVSQETLEELKYLAGNLKFEGSLGDILKNGLGDQEGTRNVGELVSSARTQIVAGKEALQEEITQTEESISEFMEDVSPLEELDTESFQNLGEIFDGVSRGQEDKMYSLNRTIKGFFRRMDLV